MTTAHAESLAFANRLVGNARRRAKRALNHLDAMTELEIREARLLAEKHCAITVTSYRAALGKRAFELRQLI